MNLSISRKILVSGISLILLALKLNSQEIEIYPDRTKENFAIEWVAQYPDITSEKQKESWTSRLKETSWLNNLIFGKRPELLTKPASIMAYSPDTIFIADQGTGTILKVIGKKGIPVRFRRSNIEAFTSLVDLCMLPDKSILFSDSYLNKVFLFNPYESPSRLKILNDSIELIQPTGIAWCGKRNEIWIVETSVHRISVLSADGKLIRQFGERGSAPGQFNYPTHIWIDKDGIAYITDAMNFRIQIFDHNGDFISMFGEAGDASGFLARPKGIATDSYGHIYIADALFHVIQVFDSKGRFLYDFGGKGKGQEQFIMPTGIYIDDKDYIYIADSYNSRIQVFKIYQKD